jgi:Protein of unknown function (DUF1203)
MMTFRITGLSPAPFRHLYGLTESALAAHGAVRMIADESPGFPDRIEMRDLAVGEAALLVNFEHQPAQTPYRSRHAIFVREGAETAYDCCDAVPDVLATRLLSVRGFSADGMIVNDEVREGKELRSVIARLFGNPAVSYLHAHNAGRGCYAGRIDRI